MKVLNNIFIETSEMRKLLLKHFQTLEEERYRNAMLMDSIDKPSGSSPILNVGKDSVTDAQLSQMLQSVIADKTKSDNINEEAGAGVSDDLISSVIDIVSGGKKTKGTLAKKGASRAIKRLGIKLGGKTGGRLAQSLTKKRTF